MKQKALLTIFTVLILILTPLVTPGIFAEDIPPLTQPPTNPNPDAHIDVFERLDRELAEGYLKDKEEIIEDNFYFTTKQGFDYIHLEGTPSEIGYNHGKLLWQKVERGMASYAFLTEMRYNMNWDVCRAQGASYWPYMPTEYREEVDGIVQGCQEMGAKNPDGAIIERNDIMAYNAIWDIWWRSSPPPIFEKYWPFMEFEEDIHHCSGFVATGETTKDGGFVICQSLWMPYHLPPSHGVFADIEPQSGNRMLMELQAGLIWSGTEWYLNEAGLVVGETTLGNAPYLWGNVPAFIRIREAVQYGSSIQEFANIMLTDTNGAYCGDYMICDAKTNEAGIVELGSRESEIFVTADGFHGSCNYPWDKEVRDEMEEPEGWEHGCYPRFFRLQQIFDMYDGEIDCEIAKRTLGDHYDTVEEKVNRCSWTLCGHVENASGYPHGSLDGKTTNRSMTLNHEVWARYGHSCGSDFDKEEHAQEHPEYAWDNLKDMIAQPWTTFGFLEPITISVKDKNGDPVEGARIAFENCADGYLLEGYTGPDGTCSHPYFQTGTYNITAKMGSRIGKITVDFNEMTTLDVTVSEQSEDGGLTSGSTLIIITCIAFILVLVIMIQRKWKARESASE